MTLARLAAAAPAPAPAGAPASAPAPRRRDWRTPLLVLALAALWLLANPWQGVCCDAQLYTVQALRLLHPEYYRHDLYFLYGSQDAFTLFSPLYAACIKALGLDGAALLLQATGSVLWLAGAACLLGFFLRGFHFWLGMAFVVALPSDFGPTPAMFTLGEPFPTPRLFAEALCMVALGLAVRRQWALGGVALAQAFLLHPLMALGAALAGALYLAWHRWRLALALLAGAAAVLAGAAALDLAPFNRILQQMDAAWLQQVRWMAPMVTWDAWHAADWASRTAVAFALVLAAARLADGARARFYWCVALAGALGLLASWLGTGVQHNLLLIQVQPWRALWLLQLVSAVALAWLLAAFWQRGRVFRLLLAVLLVAVLNRNTFGGALAVLAAWTMCLQVRRRRPWQLAPRTYRLALAAVLALGCFWLLEWLAGTGSVNAAPYGSELGLGLWLAVTSGLAMLPGALALWAAWRGGPGAPWPARVLAWALVLALLAGAACWTVLRARATRPMAPAVQQAVRARFLPFIGPDAVVYWENDLRASWFVLQRSSYGASAQVAGAAFNRGTAIEGARRLARLERLGMADAIREHDPQRARERLSRLPATTLAGLAYACSDPLLDFVVLRQPLGPGVVAQVDDAAAGRRYFLHDCARQRASLAPL